MKRNAKKLTSRILSTVLALALIISVLPVAFAEDTDKEITMPNVFPFYLNEGGFDVDGDGTRDNIGYQRDSSVEADYAATPVNITYDIGNKNVQYYAHTASYVGWVASSSDFSFKTASTFVAFRLKGLSEGKYNLTLISQLVTNGCKADIYLVPLPEEGKDYSDATAQAYTESLIKDVPALVSGYDFSSTTNNETHKKNVELKLETSGEYLFVIKQVGVGENQVEGGNGRGAKVVALILDSYVPISLGSATISAERNNMSVGETMETSLSIFNEEGGIYSGGDETVSYKSSDENVLSVDDSGVITAKGAGKAKVTVTVMTPKTDANEAVTVYADIEEITVTAPPSEDDEQDEETLRIFPFYLNEGGYDVDGDGNNDRVGYQKTDSAKADYAATPKDITYNIGNGNVQYYAHTASFVGWASNSSDFSFKTPSTFVAFRLKGVSEGKYNLTLISTLLNNGCKANIYLVPLPEEGKGYFDATAQAYVESLIKDVPATISGYDFSSTTNLEIDRENIKFTAKSSGEYLFVIKQVGVGENQTAGSNGRGAKVIALILDPIEDVAEDAPTTVTYGVFDNIDGSDAVTVQGGENNKLFGSVVTGTKISATANDKDGYTFRYWVLGSSATGRYYSSDKTVTVKPYANTSLTAIYTPEENEAVVDLFNWNGAYLKTLKASELATSLSEVQPQMTGYSFNGKWLISDKTELKADSVITKDTKAVAQFDVVGDYDKPVSSDGSSQTGWVRNGKHVTYNSTYSFFTWLNEVGEIKAYDGEAIIDKIPLVVLESNGNNFMIEYDEGEYEVVEAGILFGSTDKVDVKGAYSKATVKNLEKNNGHGQMTATSDPNGTAGMQDYARGYVIYDDNGTNKVVYTDAIANS